MRPSWGQTFSYDGFGNLTTVSVTKGSAPSLSASYSASTTAVAATVRTPTATSQSAAPPTTTATVYPGQAA
ncbi:MAG: hypothetical protein ABI824_19380 [Acidobacteriota bacterium]